MQVHLLYLTHGEEIVKKAIENDITIIPIPGACAFLNALIASGFSTREFTFIGFLPNKSEKRKEKLKEFKNNSNTLIMYEAPHRLEKTLEAILEILGNRNVVLAKEITKIHEQFIRGNLLQILEKIEEPKGEYVIILEGCQQNEDKNFLTQLSLEEHFKFYENQGFEKKEIIKKIAKDRNKTKNEIYQNFTK